MLSSSVWRRTPEAERDHSRSRRPSRNAASGGNASSSRHIHVDEGNIRRSRAASSTASAASAAAAASSREASLSIRAAKASRTTALSSAISTQISLRRVTRPLAVRRCDGNRPPDRDPPLDHRPCLPCAVDPNRPAGQLGTLSHRCKTQVTGSPRRAIRREAEAVVGDPDHAAAPTVGREDLGRSLACACLLHVRERLLGDRGRGSFERLVTGLLTELVVEAVGRRGAVLADLVDVHASARGQVRRGRERAGAARRGGGAGAQIESSIVSARLVEEDELRLAPRAGGGAGLQPHPGRRHRLDRVVVNVGGDPPTLLFPCADEMLQHGPVALRGERSMSACRLPLGHVADERRQQSRPPRSRARSARCRPGTPLPSLRRPASSSPTPIGRVRRIAEVANRYEPRGVPAAAPRAGASRSAVSEQLGARVAEQRLRLRVDAARFFRRSR